MVKNSVLDFLLSLADVFWVVLVEALTRRKVVTAVSFGGTHECSHGEPYKCFYGETYEYFHGETYERFHGETYEFFHR